MDVSRAGIGMRGKCVRARNCARNSEQEDGAIGFRGLVQAGMQPAMCSQVVRSVTMYKAPRGMAELLHQSEIQSSVWQPEVSRNRTTADKKPKI